MSLIQIGINAVLGMAGAAGVWVGLARAQRNGMDQKIEKLRDDQEAKREANRKDQDLARHALRNEMFGVIGETNTRIIELIRDMPRKEDIGRMADAILALNTNMAEQHRAMTARMDQIVMNGKAKD